MPLFQNSVLRNHIRMIDKPEALKAFETYKKAFLPKIENIRTSKEEQYQYGFLDDLFVKVLGYTLNPSPNYDLIAEQKNQTDSKKADGAILKDDKIIGVIELKSTKTKSMDKIVDQAFNYKNNHPTCRYIITSNFEKLRLYVDHSDRFEEFNLFELDENRFILLYTLLKQQNIFDDLPFILKEQSKLQEENISKELYKKYASLRTNLFENIIKNNPDVDRSILLEKTQTILDRMVFIFFAEDRSILPPNTIRAIIDHYKGDIEDRELWHFYKIYFKAINEGNSKLNIPEYNGGLFATDALLDSLVIDAKVIESLPLALSAYDFNTDIDVNILGHIFENSLNDIEELKARIEESDFDAKKTKRKKDGVFYTPEYITKYIVENTLGKLCQVKKETLGLDNVEITIPNNPKKLNKSEIKQKEALESYREYLLGLKILDPACGSGAFLNQALNYLLNEHAFIDEGIRTLMGGAVLGLYDVKKGILENNLYGVDINAEAVEIAKLSLWLRTVESGRKLNKLADKIKVGNSLIDDKSVVDNAFVWDEEFPEVFEHGGFDVVIGNPPYTYRNVELDKEFYQTNYISSQGNYDLYKFFIEKSINLFNEEGLVSLIVPNTFLTANSYSKLRQLLISSTHIDEIYDLGLKVFENVVVESVIYTLSKKSFESKTKIKIQRDRDKEIYIPDNEYLLDIVESYNNSGLFNIYLKDELKVIIDKMNSSSIKLSDVSYVTVGINTGYIKSELTANEKLDNRYHKMLNGKDIGRYSVAWAGEWIMYDKAFVKSFEDRGRSLPPEYIFTKPKILLQRTRRGLKRKLVAYLDYEQYYNLNRLSNVVLTSNDFDIKFLYVVLNSILLDFYFNSVFNEYEVKPVHLAQLPIKKVTVKEQEPLIEKADLMLLLNKKRQEIQQKFLKRLQSNFELDKLSKKLETFWKHDFKTLLSELKKKKITLALAQQDEWEEYFETYQKELLALQSEIDATDKEIDQMVYELYGLNEEEIKVLEGS